MNIEGVKNKPKFSATSKDSVLQVPKSSEDVLYGTWSLQQDQCHNKGNAEIHNMTNPMSFAQTSYYSILGFKKQNVFSSLCGSLIPISK